MAWNRPRTTPAHGSRSPSRGLYWLVPGVLLAFTVGMVNSWSALIEILR